MVEWVSCIVLSIIAVTLIDVVMAEGETKKFIKGIASLMVLFAVISPLPKLLNTSFNWDTIMESESTFNINTNYIDESTKIKVKSYEAECESYLNSRGISGAKVTLFYESGSTGQVEINFAQVDIKSVIIPDSSNINIANNIIAYMKDRFGLPSHKIAIIG